MQMGQAAFTPPLTGDVSATMRLPLRIKGSSRNATLSLLGASEAPRLCIEPAAIDLGAALIGERIGTRVTLRNPGSYPIQVRPFFKHARPLAALMQPAVWLGIAATVMHSLCQLECTRPLCRWWQLTGTRFTWQPTTN